ncbi:hypothetical protein [Xanthobacter versatilis]|uniref:hypothetical protein n=1 Tax=Xanthobacter autotrophicus (strain ATCC BAA-1158 / Py2) TaxID=78245 RepID=UPI0037298512
MKYEQHMRWRAFVPRTDIHLARKRCDGIPPAESHPTPPSRRSYDRPAPLAQTCRATRIILASLHAPAAGERSPRPPTGVKALSQLVGRHGEKSSLTIPQIYPEMDRLLAGVLIRPKVLRRRVGFGD